jgi:predicted Na+-dependent transporter
VTTWHLLKPQLWFLLLPLVIGVAVRWRYPAVARELAPRFLQVALVGIVLHIILMFIAFWDDVVAEVRTGEYLYSVFLPFGCLIVGYGVCSLFAGGRARPAGRGILLPGSLGTAQSGSQSLICSLIFAMGAYPVAGVVALGSSVITVVILVVLCAEIGRHHDRHSRRPAASAAEGEASPSDRPGVLASAREEQPEPALRGSGRSPVEADATGDGGSKRWTTGRAGPRAAGAGHGTMSPTDEGGGR